jgi:uncharacterized BrkB/YihY/UPF0761 family membrane protein
MNLTSDLISSYPIILIFVIVSGLITLLYGALTVSRDNKKVKLKYIEVASSILKPTFSTTNKKQIYLTEQLFQSHYKYPFTYAQISVLLSCENPSKAISEFPNRHYFLKLSDTKNSFIERNSEDGFIYNLNSWWTGFALFMSYMVLASSGVFIGYIGLELYDHFLEVSILSAYTSTSILFILSVILLFLAYKSLSSVFKKNEAQKFLKEHF